tara:strand:- start:291 stop:497 length:207 start_codon:yes stop_codon:yes gene_type:complete
MRNKLRTELDKEDIDSSEISYRRGYRHGYNQGSEDAKNKPWKSVCKFFDGKLMAWAYSKDRSYTPPTL